jgi:hypothetical protein
MGPPAGRDRSSASTRGGGAAGNVGANTLTVLKQSIAFVAGVTNPFRARRRRGEHREAKRRGTYAIKNRDRAITSEDYNRWRAASRRVARAKCVQSSDGSISLLLVPKSERENGDARAIPSRDLIDRVAGYIDQRRLITARVNVGKPRLVPLSLELTISLKPGATADRVKADVKEKVKSLNPCTAVRRPTAGPSGARWARPTSPPCGRRRRGSDHGPDHHRRSRRLRVEMLSSQTTSCRSCASRSTTADKRHGRAAHRHARAHAPCRPRRPGAALARRRAGPPELKLVDSRRRRSRWCASTRARDEPGSCDQGRDRHAALINYLPDLPDADQGTPDFLQRFRSSPRTTSSGGG